MGGSLSHSTGELEGPRGEMSCLKLEYGRRLENLQLYQIPVIATVKINHQDKGG